MMHSNLGAGLACLGLVDGLNSSTGNAVNDGSRVRNGVGDILVNVSRFSSAAAPNRNEAIAFGAARAPRRDDMPWTSNGGDSFPLALGNELSLDITVWIVKGPFNTQRDHALDTSAETSTIWEDERMGIRFASFQVNDATNDPDIALNPQLLDSTGGDNRDWDAFSNDIGFDAGRINIYWINSVDGGTGTGWSDFGARIVMGKDTGLELLVHELGHAFSLQHPVGCFGSTANFDPTNVMWQCSTIRQYLTEGQVFRTHFNDDSSVNALYSARPGEPTAACQSGARTPECPALERRLWDDGSYPAN